MSSLLGLPAELMEQVLTSCSIPTLSKLSRTNKALHQFLTPAVYKSIDWYWKDDGPAPPLDLLLRTLLQTPLRAKHIKLLRLRGGGITPEREWKNWWPDCERDCPRPFHFERTLRSNICFSHYEVGKVARLVHNIYRPIPSAWMSELRRGGVDVIVALLLSRLFFLEHLDLGLGYLYHSHFIPAILRHTTVHRGRQSTFPKLRTLDFALDTPSRSLHFTWADIDLLRPLFFFPSLEHIDTVSPEPIIFAWPSNTPKASYLTSLVLRKSTIQERTLGKLLSCTQELRHLTYDHHRPVYSIMREDGDIIQIRCRLLNDALSSIRTTLESLVLRVTYVGSEGLSPPDPLNYEGPLGVSGRLTVLSSMPRLTNLEAPWVLLHGMHIEVPVSWVEVIPNTLQNLRLRDDIYESTIDAPLYNATLNRVSQLSCLRKQFFPKLKSISFISFLDHYWLKYWYDCNGDRLRALCKAANMDCEIGFEDEFDEDEY